MWLPRALPLLLDAAGDTERLNTGTRGNRKVQPLVCIFTDKIHELFFGGVFDRPVALSLRFKADGWDVALGHLVL